MNETQLRAFVRGYWENADHETKKGEPLPPMTVWGDYKSHQREVMQDYYDRLTDFWYERGIKDLAEMVMAKLGETK